MKKLLLITIIALYTIITFSQDSYVRKNVIAFVPTSLLNRTISFSYNRIVKPNAEISFKTSVRIAKEREQYKEYNTIPTQANAYTIDDPFWYYNRMTTQVGFFHHKNIAFYEPTIYYEYGYFNNQTLMTDDDNGEAEDSYCRLDRKYHAMGCSFNTGLCYNYDRFRLKLLIGLAYSFRFYQEKIYEYWYQYNPPSPDYIYIPDDPITKYTKNRFGIKAGVEIGFKF
jgi:hypothetical protein